MQTYQPMGESFTIIATPQIRTRGHKSENIVEQFRNELMRRLIAKILVNEREVVRNREIL